MFFQLVRNVPLLAPKNQAIVSKETRDASVKSMLGHAVEAEHDEGESDEPEAGSAECEIIAASKERKIYKQTSESMVPWFPHDNDMDLLKELCHESGVPRWIIFGTPAGGAGIQGCLEMNLSVVAFCWDDVHEESLQRCMLERGVESLVAGTTTVFKDPNLHSRAGGTTSLHQGRR